MTAIVERKPCVFCTSGCLACDRGYVTSKVDPLAARTRDRPRHLLGCRS